MKKKVTQKLKGSSSNTKKTKKIMKSKLKPSSSRSKVPAKPVVKVDPRFTQAVQNYEAGLRAMQGHKFDRAKTAFEKLLDGPSTELADRARLHLNICEQQLARTSTSFKTPEEHYDYAVSLMNSGDYDSARSHLEKILKQYPKTDYVWYGLAVLDCLTGRIEDALRNLQQAIKLNAANRFQARNDSDFTKMADDPRFTELLYPEPGELEAVSPATSASKSNGNSGSKKR
jgi:tetratricopeptide (TPR) repeat protein